MQKPLQHELQRPLTAIGMGAALALAVHLLPAAPTFLAQLHGQSCKTLPSALLMRVAVACAIARHHMLPEAQATVHVILDKGAVCHRKVIARLRSGLGEGLPAHLMEALEEFIRPRGAASTATSSSFCIGSPQEYCSADAPRMLC